MKIYKDKLAKEIKPHEWFAWYPVWTWESKDSNVIQIVWLEKVIRTNGYMKKYKYYLK